MKSHLCGVLLLIGTMHVSQAGAAGQNQITTPATSSTIAQTSYTEMWLEVQVAGRRPVHTLLLLRQEDGQMLIRGADLELWRLRVPETNPIRQIGDDYYRLNDINGLRYEVDETQLTLKLEASPQLFELTELENLRNSPQASPATRLGGFFNYDVNAGYAAGKTAVNGLLELGLFGGRGVATNTLVVNDRDYGANAVRLDSTWTRDMPELRASFRAGDAISGVSDWGRSVRFGGVQWATNFATQPGFITFPLPTLSGEAALPSSMELYVNGILRMRDEVPSGPFSITDAPVVTGGGEVQLVLLDILGREQLITQSFYASAALLQKGLHEFSYEMGSIREFYGIRSNDYGRFMGAATHRLGLTDWFTGEARVELLNDQQTIGVGGALLWQDKGVFHLSMAASHSGRGEGGLLGIGFDHSTPAISFGLGGQLTTEQFTQLGLLPNQPAPRLIGRAFVSVPVRQYGSVSVNYGYQDNRIRKRFETLGVSYSVSLGWIGFLSASATKFFESSGDTSFNFSLTHSLGPRITASANASFRHGSQQLFLQAQRNLPAGSGFGYRARAGLLDADSVEAGISAQTDYGTYFIDAASYRGKKSYRGYMSGGLTFLDGNFNFSRRIVDSFAVIKVDEFANVRVYADNQVVATTNADGRALIPRIRAYQSNKIRIETEDLPMDAKIDGVELEAVPYFRSGLLLKFPVERSRGGLLTILLGDGKPLPAGILVKRLEDDMEFPTGFNGQVYMTGWAAHNRLRVTWLGQICEFDVDYPETEDPLPELGTFTCSGVIP